MKRYKTHSVAKDFTQEYGFDFEDTFAPIYKLNSVKSLLAVSNSMLMILKKKKKKSMLIEATEK